MSGADRRTFVKRMAAASAAAAAASLVPGSSFGDEVGRAVAVRGDPESPVNRGLACVKGYHSVQALYGRDRLKRAMVRRGGRLVEVPMEEALDLVARRLRETMDRHGKDSVAMLHGLLHWRRRSPLGFHLQCLHVEGPGAGAPASHGAGRRCRRQSGRERAAGRRRPARPATGSRPRADGRRPPARG